MTERDWAPVEAADLPEGLILFDGVCVLCSAWVRFVYERDGESRFAFTPIQSAYGRALAERFGIDPEAPETNVVVLRGEAHFKSDSAIRVLERLPRWSWVRLVELLPRRWRHALYDRVARNRYRIFGRTETCMMPEPALAARTATDGPPRPRAPGPSPLQVVLGPGYERLPPLIRAFHAPRTTLRTAGRAEVTAPPGRLPRLLRRLAGLPEAGGDVEVSVVFRPEPGFREHWARRFAGRTYASTMTVGTGSSSGALVERFGPFRLRFDLLPGPKGLAWSLAGWKLWGIALPSKTLPWISCFETESEGRFGFDIDVAFPLAGPVVHYKGWLAPVT